MRISYWSSDVCSSDLELAERAMARFSQIKGGTVIAMIPPAVMELGNATGFDLFLEDRNGLGHAKLMEARNQFLSLAGQSPALSMVRPNGMSDEPQFRSEERRVGKECVSTCRSRWSTYN